MLGGLARFRYVGFSPVDEASEFLSGAKLILQNGSAISLQAKRINFRGWAHPVVGAGFGYELELIGLGASTGLGAGPETELITQEAFCSERIEKTKRSKNDQKPTRNGKKTKSQEQEVRNQPKIKPDQPDTAGKKVKSQNKVKRTKVDKFSKFEGFI
ncbi:hypothetical protein Tco_0810693 [Tanacetum coccineum]